MYAEDSIRCLMFVPTSFFLDNKLATTCQDKQSCVALVNFCFDTKTVETVYDREMIKLSMHGKHHGIHHVPTLTYK